MSDDIVARLRAVLHNDRSVELMNREAADEIERLHRDYSCICGEMRRMMDERDEARRWVCQLLASPESVMHLAKPGNGTKRHFAAEQGWDCFKEATDEP